MILNHIIQTFNKPYPFLFFPKRNFIIAIALCLLIFIINLMSIDESYVQDNFIFSKVVICTLAGLVTAFSVFFTVELIPRIFFKPNLKENWSVGKEFLLTIFLFVIIAISNSIMSLTIMKEDIYNIPSHLLNISLNVILIGSIPTLLIIWGNYTIILKENLKEISSYNKRLESKLSLEKNISTNNIAIQTNNKKEVLQLDLNTFLFAKSDGNYTDIFTKNNEKYDSRPYRITLRELGNALDEYAFIVSPHRSYIINTRNISSTSGNARNYRIHFDRTPHVVPVSRDKFQILKEALDI